MPAVTARCRRLALLLGLALPAVAQEGAKSSGPVVLLPRLPVAEGRLDPLLPGREYRAGGGWWALACPAGCVLYPLTLSVRAERHPVYDGDPVPGQRLVFAPPPPVDEVLAVFKPWRLAQGLPLRSGPVTTYFPGTLPRLRRPASPGTMEGEVGLPGGAAARLVPTLLLPPAGGAPGEPALTLELQLDGRRQSLGAFHFGIEGPRALKPSDYLMWAGDLDGDGRPDFLIRFDFHGTDQALFLSSLARGDELVGEAGRFRYFPIDIAGC